MEKVVATPEAFEEEVRRFADALLPSTEGATLVTLSGELGAGKTAFAKVVARALGVEGIVNSPTFVLEKMYHIPDGKGFTDLIHIDAYRLENGGELAPLDFADAMKDPKNLILLEWPEKVADALPTPTIKISITAHTDGSRTISYG